MVDLLTWVTMSFVILQIFLQFMNTKADIDILYKKDICDEEEFYIPYIRLLRTRQPYHEKNPILKLLSPGYIDVSGHTGIMCINGPAIVYTDVHKDIPDKCSAGLGSSPNSPVPSKGEPEMFSHECFSINRLGRESYKSGDPLQLQKDSQVYGNKIFGVYLLGQPPDYRLPNFIFLPRPDFGYKTESSSCISDGASLAFVTNSSESSRHCYEIKKLHMEGTLYVSYTGSPLFCYREDREDEFDTPFHKGKAEPITFSDVLWDQNGETCAADAMAEMSSDSAKQEFDSEPRQLPDFRIIDPLLLSDKGSQAVMYRPKRLTADMVGLPIYDKPTGSLYAGEPEWKNPAEQTKETTIQPLQKFQAEISVDDCEALPIPQENCVAKTPLEPCAILYHVLTLEETDWASPKSTIKDGSWRKPIFNIINKIYERACPQVSKYLSSSLSRVFQHLLQEEIEANDTMKQELNKPRNLEWADIIANLNNCSTNSQMMSFFKKKDTSVVKLKRKLEAKLELVFERIERRIALKGATVKHADDDPGASTFEFSSPLSRDQEHLADLGDVEKIGAQLSEIPFQFPYKILIGSPNKKGYEGASRVHHYREAAEIDYELDWALDSYWKVITTVLGYCHMHFDKNITSSLFYERFNVDFFRYVTRAWITGDNQPVYEQIFGDFIHGSGALWIDACHNGAYQWSEIVELRPLRPLDLLEGDTPPAHANAGNSGPANFFLDSPIHSKTNKDIYDYYDDAGNGQSNDSPELYVTDKKAKGSRLKRLGLAEAVEASVDPLTNLV